jgi:hypothetical protein
MPTQPSKLPFAILFSLAACADQPYVDDDAAVCTHAADTLVACGHTLEQSPFGTCQPEQHALAQRVLDVYATDGCAGLADAKADSWTCTVLPFLCVNHSVGELVPFVSDGCSMFPDGTLSEPTRWQHCCIVHDFAYYAGGPESAREAADHELQRCIGDAANQGLADLMYFGVRLGGTPSLPTPWRWGYGWTYDPLDGYRALPAAQASAAATNIAAYQANPVPPDAIEQRVRALAADITTVPGLQGYIDLISAAVRQL